MTSKPYNELIASQIAESKQRGRSWATIAAQFEISVTDVHAIYTEYMNKSPVLDQVTQRKVQMDRLESLLDMLHDLVYTQKDLEAVSRALLVIKQISELAELKQKQATTTINIIDQRQLTEVTVYMESVTESLKRKMLAAAPADLKKSISQHWDEWVAEAAEHPQRKLANAQEVINL